MATSPDQLYDEDFFSWTQFQARELQRLARTYPNPALDLPHIAEEVRDLGREQKARLRGWTVRTMTNLLVLEHGLPDPCRKAAVRQILDDRFEIALRESVTLLRDLNRQLRRLYREARMSATIGLEADAVFRLPVDCPYTLDQVLGDWWPEEPDRPRDR